MKITYGAHIYLWLERWADEHIGLLNRARELGLSYLEISIGDDVQFDPALLGMRALSLGLQLTVGPGGAWPNECDISDEAPNNRRLGLAWHRRAIDRAGEMGAIAYCGAIYGRPGVIRKRRPRIEDLYLAAEGLNNLAEHAQARGLKLVVEPMSHFRTHIANTPEQIMRLVEMADHPNLYVALDTYHLVTEIRDYGKAVHTCREKLWTIHACENDRGVPGGGLVPWNTIFAALRQIEFSGHVLFETYNSSIGEFAASRGLFQDICPDGDEFVRQGIGFLEACRAAARKPE